MEAPSHPPVVGRRRTRAPAACTNCHWRKARCSAFRHGVPCTNCRVEGVPCIVHSAQWRGSHQHLFETNPVNPISTSKGNDSTLEALGNQGKDGSSLSNLSNPWEASSSSEYLLSMLENTLDFSQEPSPKASISSQSNESIRAPPSHLAKEDIEYLKQKGALSVPEEEVTCELIRCYAEFVHPISPVLELYDFLPRRINGLESRDGVSLLLMQAVMFSGTAFVEMEIVRKLGFKTRMEARKAFFQKAKLLYDFDYEPDRISMIQSLLLMTLWYETPDDQKDCWHWLNVTITHAKTIGLNQRKTTIGTDVQEQRLRKRLWWCCLIRDPIIAMGMKRHVIAPETDVPMLTLDDFEFKEPLSINGLTLDRSRQRELAVLFIEQAKLCLVLRRVLQNQYSVIERPPAMGDSRTRSTSILLPRQVESDATQFGRCEEDLRLWYEGLPAGAVYHPVGPGNSSSAGRNLVVFRDYVYLLYLTTLSTLHRPRCLASAGTYSQEQTLLSRQKLRQAANETTGTLRDLYRLRCCRYLPLTGITIICSAMMSHVDDMRFSRDELVCETARAGYEQCMQVLVELRDRHWAADFAVQLLELAVRRSTLSQPEGNQVSSKSTLEDVEKSLWSSSDDMSTMQDAGMGQDAAPTSMANDGASRGYHSISIPWDDPESSDTDPSPFFCLKDSEDIFGGLSPSWALQEHQKGKSGPTVTSIDPTMAGIGWPLQDMGSPFQIGDYIMSTPPDEKVTAFV